MYLYLTSSAAADELYSLQYSSFHKPNPPNQLPLSDCVERLWVFDQNMESTPPTNSLHPSSIVNDTTY